jgi:hypothetical protein
MVSLLEAKLAVTVEGLGGKVPSSNCWNKEKSSFRRHVQASFVVMREPLIGVKGSGSLETVGVDGLLGTAGQVVAFVEPEEVVVGPELDDEGALVVEVGVVEVEGGLLVLEVGGAAVLEEARH